MTVKEKVFRLIDRGDNQQNYSGKLFEIIIIVLIIASIVEIILESFDTINNAYSSYFEIFEIFTVVIFSVEYLLRLWTADLKFKNESRVGSRIKFITSGTGIIDLLAILPFYLPLIFKFDLRFIRVLRVIRLTRILKLNRSTKAFKIIGSIFIEKRSELAITIFVTIILMLISSTIMYNLEHEVQKEAFPDIISTFWWAISTLTTVGYGDVYPITGWGKIISGIIALLGIGLVALPTGIISSGFFEKVESEKSKEKSYKYCPHCGVKI